MQTSDFFNKVLSDDGYYCVVGIKDGVFNQKFFGTLESAVDNTSSLQLDGNDVFFALGTFVEEGKRTTENIKYLKAFFLDVDCGDDKGYPTKSDAITALKAFRAQNSTP